MAPSAQAPKLVKADLPAPPDFWHPALHDDRRRGDELELHHCDRQHVAVVAEVAPISLRRTLSIRAPDGARGGLGMSQRYAFASMSGSALVVIDVIGLASGNVKVRLSFNL